MKKSSILVVVVLVSVFLSGCAGEQSPETTLLNAIQKSKSTDNYRIKYRAELNLAGFGAFAPDESQIPEFILEKFRKGNNGRLDGYMDGVLSARNYYLGDAIYSCTLDSGKWECVIKEEEFMMSPSEMPINLDDRETMSDLEVMLETGALILSKPQERTIAGRKCDIIRMEIKPEELSEQDIELMNGDFLTGRITSEDPGMSMTFCFERETGLILESRYEISLEGAIPEEIESPDIPDISITITATEFETDLYFAPDFFDLPA